MSELLKGSTLTAEQAGFTDSIRVCADTLLTVINDILDYSKLDAGKMVLHNIPMSLKETINEVVRALSYSHKQKDVKTITNLDIDNELLVMGDPVRFHQILMSKYIFYLHICLSKHLLTTLPPSRSTQQRVQVHTTRYYPRPTRCQPRNSHRNRNNLLRARHRHRYHL